MATGEYIKQYHDSDDYSKIIGEDHYVCSTGSLALENIDPSMFDFSFLTSDGGIVGEVKKIMEILEIYINNTQAYDVDGKNNFEDAYNKLKDEVDSISNELGALQETLENQVQAISAEITSNYNWAYTASFSDQSWGQRG